MAEHDSMVNLQAVRRLATSDPDTTDCGQIHRSSDYCMEYSRIFAFDMMCHPMVSQRAEFALRYHLIEYLVRHRVFTGPGMGDLLNGPQGSDSIGKLRRNTRIPFFRDMQVAITDSSDDGGARSAKVT